ncbi:hypothetical protein DSO57_1036764 [Entomophthora muscae]|uniref:Uncharacterized protein n=1 Tax=Entomophthora muscae TaxID=34485 RepID=A0ACC2SZR3_9FUNG|nr:hypothetical protein DSO57_1036764 [Entomophthora muscae]
MSCQSLWMVGLVAAATLVDKRLEDLYIKIRPRWKFPLRNTIDGPVSLLMEGWVSPGAQVEVRPRLKWTTKDFELKAPKLNKEHIKTSLQKCHRYDTSTETRAFCYAEGYYGFYWGNPIRVSGRQTCRSKTCMFYPRLSKPINYSSNPKVVSKAPFLLDYILPPSPTPFKVGLTFNSSLNYKARVKGPTRGCIWFKPLLWGTQGWYSSIILKKNASFVQSYQIETTFPLSFNNSATGVYIFLPTSTPPPTQAK